MNKFNKIIKTTINKFILENLNTEVNNNLSMDEFDKDMENLGFIKDGGRAGSRAIYHLKDGGLKITTHDPGKTAKASMLRNVFNALKNIKWFDNEDNFKKFPFDRWQFKPDSIERNTITQDIQQANELYKNAEVYRVFYNNNPLSILKTKQGYNLCRSNEDRRPLLDKWYDGFEQGNIPTLKLDDYEKLETKAYPIKQNGTLDIDNVIIENKINNNMKKKQLIRLTENDLHRIIKESVNNILKENDYLFFYDDDDDDDNYYINAKETYSDNSDEYTPYYPHVDVDMNFTPHSYLTQREWQDRFLDKAY